MRDSAVIVRLATACCLTVFAAPLAAQQRPAATRPESLDVCPGPCEPKRVWTAIGEGLLINLLVNRIDVAMNPPDGAHFAVGPDTWASNLRLGWTWDDNKFSTNMFEHPYHGSTYFNAGRSNGMNFWESAPLTFLGSWSWEFFGEAVRPSLNDFFMTSFGGIAVGEMLHRAGALIRDNRATGSRRTWREISSTLVDPVGSFNRLIFGRTNDIGPNPIEHFPNALGLRLSTGARVVGDSSGGLDNSAAAGTVLFDIRYGDAFAAGYRQPWDVFRMRAQVSFGQTAAGGGLNLLEAVGRLYGSELSPAGARNRHQATIWQRYDYRNNPAQVFGGQSIGAGFVSEWGTGGAWSVRTAAGLEAIVMGAVQGDSASTTGLRTYDFGPGLGIGLAASLSKNGTERVSGSYRSDYIHSVSGFVADHYVHMASLEAQVPLRNNVGIGAAGYLYLRNSRYPGLAKQNRRYPEFRVYLTWLLDYRPAAVEGSR
jgi:hypothetical protein